MKPRAVVRRLLYAQGVMGFGDGLWFSIWAIFFTRTQGIPAQSMGLAVGLGGAVGLLAAVPVGVLADHHGPRRMLVLTIALRAGAMGVYVFVADFWSLLLVTMVFTAMQSSAAGVRVTYIYGLMAPEERLRTLAQSRVVQHIAYAIGAGAAGLVLSVDSKPIFVVAILVTSAAFLGTAWLTLLLPRVPAVPVTRRQGNMRALRDLPYVIIMASTALLSLCWAILSSGLPLWVANDAAAPLWTAALAVAVSSLAIALFQVRVTRQSGSVPRAVRSAHISAVSLAACCVAFALAALPRSPLLALMVIMVGVGLHIVGELYYVSSRWGLSLGLMARDAEGQYQGLAAATEAAAVALGPAVVTMLITGLHWPGWIIIGAVLIVAVAPTRSLAARALRDDFRVLEPEKA